MTGQTYLATADRSSCSPPFCGYHRHGTEMRRQHFGAEHRVSTECWTPAVQMVRDAPEARIPTAGAGDTPRATKAYTTRIFSRDSTFFQLFGRGAGTRVFTSRTKSTAAANKTLTSIRISLRAPRVSLLSAVRANKVAMVQVRESTPGEPSEIIVTTPAQNIDWPVRGGREVASTN